MRRLDAVIERCLATHADRGAPEWTRPPVEDVEALFASLTLTGEFWRLR